MSLERKNRSVGVLACDDGGFSTCVVTKSVMEKYPSVKGLFGKDRNLTSITGKHDFIVEYKDGETYVLGTLAQWDCSLPLQWHGKSKQHDFFDLSVLTSVFVYGYIDNYIAVSVPITEHTPEEKQGRIDRLKGSHTLTVNGITKTFYISEVIVVPETVSSFWSIEPTGLTRWLDLGSRTIGAGSVYKEGDVNRFIDTQSTSFQKGIESLGSQFNPKGLAEYLSGRLFAKSWEESDSVYLVGGGAMIPELVEEIRKYFHKATVVDDPSMSNAKGMYNLARHAFGMN